MPVPVRSLARAADAPAAPPADSLTLPQDDRVRRRILLTCDGGLEVMLDLPQTTAMKDGDHLLLDDGRSVVIRAAIEPLMQAVPPAPTDLPRICWHVGNRHMAAQIEPDRLLLRRDKVIAEMLRGLGCAVSDIDAPFEPERGAYSHGHGHHHHSHD